MYACNNSKPQGLEEQLGHEFSKADRTSRMVEARDGGLAFPYRQADRRDACCVFSDESSAVGITSVALKWVC